MKWRVFRWNTETGMGSFDEEHHCFIRHYDARRLRHASTPKLLVDAEYANTPPELLLDTVDCYVRRTEINLYPVKPKEVTS